MKKLKQFLWLVLFSLYCIIQTDAASVYQNHFVELRGLPTGADTVYIETDWKGTEFNGVDAASLKENDMIVKSTIEVWDVENDNGLVHPYAVPKAGYVCDTNMNGEFEADVDLPVTFNSLERPSGLEGKHPCDDYHNSPAIQVVLPFPTREYDANSTSGDVKEFEEAAAEADWAEFGIDNRCFALYNKPPMSTGTCGDNLTWTLDTLEWSLTIEGTGEMYDYLEEPYSPWDSYSSRIRTINIGEGVTSIGAAAFYNCNITSIELPSTMKRIGDTAFRFCTNLESVKLSEGLTDIGYAAFSSCTSLNKLSIPASVTNIASRAFLNCMSLTSIAVSQGNTRYDSRNNCNAIVETAVDTLMQGCMNTNIPVDVVKIGDCAFYGCQMAAIVIPESVTSIGDYAFYECDKLNSISFPNGLESIGEYAFYGCSSLNSVAIPEGVTSIGSASFCGCSSLTSVSLPNGLASIGEYAFYGCSSLNSVAIPEGVTSIGSASFCGCSSLTSVSLPNGLASIGEYAFRESGLTSITIPSGVKNIGYAAFYDCANLASVVFSGSVQSIDDYAFNKCPNIEVVHVYGEPAECLTNIFDYSVYENAILFIHGPYYEAYYRATGWEGFNKVGEIFSGICGDSLTWSYNTYTHELTISGTGDMWDWDALDEIPWRRDNPYKINPYKITIEEGVTSIGNSAFDGCSFLSYITLPEGVTSIGDMAFCYCRNLSYITLPESLTSIGTDAFSGCESLPIVDGLRYADTYLIEAVDVAKDRSTYNIKEGTRFIGYRAFDYCENLTSIVLPSSVVAIEESAFSFCEKLTSISIPEGVDSIASNVFYCCYNLASVALPNSLKSIGNSAFYSCESLSSINFPENLTSIGEWAFEDCEKLNSIVIPDGVERIEYGTFAGCSNLTSVTIPISVTSIGNVAFSGCGFASITIPESVTSIGPWAFETCQALYSVAIPEGVKVIENGTFAGCTSLSKVALPKGLTSIGEEAFAYCNSLGSIEIPKSVSNIGPGAFYGCSFLSSITIPEGVTIIESGTFYECGGLTTVVIPASVSNIGQMAFTSCPSIQSVTVCGSVPPSCVGVSFDKTVYNNAMLYVPVGSADTYRNAPFWMNFLHITETDTKVAAPETDEANAPIYDLSGRRIDDADAVRGIYLQNGKKVYRK